MKRILTSFILAAFVLTGWTLWAQDAPSPSPEPTPIDVLFVGDSITDFWDNPGRGLDVYKQYYDGPRRVINIGVSGDICDQTLARLDQPKVANIKPTLIQLMIGTNNLDRGKNLNPPYIINGIGQILAKLGQKWPEAKILLLGVFPRGFEPGNNYQNRIDQINKELPKFADGKKIFYMDISKAFLTEEGLLDKNLFPDQLHPNTAGYVKWAQAVEPFFKEILGGSSVKPEPQGGDWWKKRFASKLEEIKKADGQIDLVYLGDSITHNWESKGANVWKEFYGNRKAINLGYSGDRTENVLWRLDNGEADGYTPKIVVLMIGTNNVGHRRATPRQTIEGIRAILEKLGQKWPETKVLLLPVFPRGADENDSLRKAVNEINAGAPVLADGKRVIFCDFNDKLLTPEKVLTREMMPDLLHPAKGGYVIWAQAVEPFIKEALGE